jgi:dimethylsulfone monooxygenase
MPFINPLYAAKMIATVDHISGGRMGINATAGYFQPEYDMFGIEIPPHDVRYDLADEWMTILRRLWDDEDVFDFKGEFFDLKAAQSYPKPVQSPGPAVMSAGSSPAGQAFAFKHANILFASITHVEQSAEVAPKLRSAANGAGREDLALWIPAHIICKDTEKEANEYVEYINSKGDYESAAGYKHVIQSGDGRSFNWENFKEAQDPTQDETIKTWFRAGLAPIVGTPEMVVESLEQLHKAGVSGIAIGNCHRHGRL